MDGWIGSIDLGQFHLSQCASQRTAVSQPSSSITVAQSHRILPLGLLLFTHSISGVFSFFASSFYPISISTRIKDGRMGDILINPRRSLCAGRLLLSYCILLLLDCPLSGLPELQQQPDSFTGSPSVTKMMRPCVVAGWLATVTQDPVAVL